MISVIIPTYSKLSRLKYVIMGLEQQTASREQFEVIVVNDGSTDRTQQYLESIHPNFSLTLVNQENRGQAVARNNGILKASGDIILFIDDDILIPPDFIDNHIKAHKMNPNTIILGKINLIYAELFEQFECLFQQKSYKEALNSLQDLSHQDLYLGMVETIFRKKFYPLFWICFTGGNTSVEYKTLEKTGFFDEQFYRWGPEDIELGYRCKLTGIKFMYQPECYCYHLDLLKNRNQMLSDTMKNVKYLKGKYPNSSSVQNYIDFTSGGFTLEEFYCRETGLIFRAEDYDTLFRFRPFDYINIKSR